MIYVECELCGRAGADKRAEVEGAVLNVCERCSSLGKDLTPVQITQVNKKPVPKLPDELEVSVIPNFSDIIRKTREKKNLTQQQLAANIKETMSSLRRIEEGWEPPLTVLQKIERELSIRLLERVSAGKSTALAKKPKLTIGDMIEVKV
ncbi:MAG: TIGR00270 family protein [Candidatus Aenigmarchaeota archaeon]|nr:TIGR00270 family protein [Candidatus Aenigmarchaeota archaeon]